MISNSHTTLQDPHVVLLYRYSCGLDPMVAEDSWQHSKKFPAYIIWKRFQHLVVWINSSQHTIWKSFQHLVVWIYPSHVDRGQALYRSKGDIAIFELQVDQRALPAFAQEHRMDSGDEPKAPWSVERVWYLYHIDIAKAKHFDRNNTSIYINKLLFIHRYSSYDQLNPSWRFGTLVLNPTWNLWGPRGLRYIDHAGVLRVCGGADLKGSQYYPKLFGHSVAQLYQRHSAEVQATVKSQMTLGLIMSMFQTKRL